MTDNIAIVLGQSDLDLLYSVSNHLANPSPERAWLREQRDTPVQQMPRQFVESFQIALGEELRIGTDLNTARRAEFLTQRLAGVA